MTTHYTERKIFTSSYYVHIGKPNLCWIEFSIHIKFIMLEWSITYYKGLLAEYGFYDNTVSVHTLHDEICP